MAKPKQSTLKSKANNVSKKSLKTIKQTTEQVIEKTSKKLTVNAFTKSTKKINKNDNTGKITSDSILVAKKTVSKDVATQKTISAKSTNKTDFSIDDFIIYPSHGVGQIKSIETLEIAGGQHHLYIIYFDKEKLTIKIPVNKALSLGLRHPVSKKQIEDVLSTLRTGIKKTKGMWSRRAQEYETKINSGDIFLLAEVVRDLTRDIEDSERSFSERVIYETAVFRLAYEYSIVYGCNIEEAKEKIIIVSKDKVVSIQNKVDKYDFDFDDIDRTKNDEEEDEEEDEEDDEEDHYKALDKYITEEDDEDLLEQFKKAERTVGVKKNKPPKKNKKNG